MFSNGPIAFIGSGVMAEAAILGLIGRKVVEPDRIVAAGPRVERGQQLAEKYGISVAQVNAEAARDAGVIILSVKPQVMSHVLSELRGHVPPGALVISIAAGVKIETITKGLVQAEVARAMPNTPAQVGEGITVWTCTPEVGEMQRAQVSAILGALGQEVYVDDEDYLDMATALSGTGPAYVFLFMEALVDAGVHLGFPRRLAEQLVVQTVKGSVDFYNYSPSHLARLRNQVTSPGGTSAEALYYLEKAGFRTALSRAVWAAYQRSVALGRGKKRSQGPDGEK